MDNFSPIGNWADEPLDSPPQGNSPKKENQQSKKRHSSIERYRPHGGGGYEQGTKFRLRRMYILTCTWEPAAGRVLVQEKLSIQAG